MNTQKDIQKDVKEKSLEIRDFSKTLTLKTERIATAIYLVTDVMEQTEPLKKKIRETVLQALSKTTQSASQEILSLIHELEQLFSLAKIGNCISHMNASILIEELQKVQKMIQNQHAFPADFFADDIEVKETPQTQIQPVETKQETDFKGHSVAERPVGAMSFKKQSVVSVTQNQRQNGRKSKRRDMIIDALRKKGKTSIKDIARLVRGCSEKTIQRELGDLIDEGLVLKEGERRWSRYRLV